MCPARIRLTKPDSAGGQWRGSSWNVPKMRHGIAESDRMQPPDSRWAVTSAHASTWASRWNAPVSALRQEFPWMGEKRSWSATEARAQRSSSGTTVPVFRFQDVARVPVFPCLSINALFGRLFPLTWNRIQDDWDCSHFFVQFSRYRGTRCLVQSITKDIGSKESDTSEYPNR